jgi:hypothetical protein
MWSRIDFMKQYEPLSRKSQRQLWKSFLRKIDPHVGDEYLEELVEHPVEKKLNGWEVSD